MFPRLQASGVKFASHSYRPAVISKGRSPVDQPLPIAGALVSNRYHTATVDGEITGIQRSYSGDKAVIKRRKAILGIL